MYWISLDKFKGHCDSVLINLVEEHNKHFQEMGEMTPEFLLYNDKENPNQLLNQLEQKYQFFSESKWALERYKNRKCGVLNFFESQLVKYLENFYVESYPVYELNLIGCIDTLKSKVCYDNLKEKIDAFDKKYNKK